MKEYEKWLKGKAGIGWYTGTAEGWKAALKWIKYAGVLEPGLANDLIDEELEA